MDNSFVPFTETKQVAASPCINGASQTMVLSGCSFDASFNLLCCRSNFTYNDNSWSPTELISDIPKAIVSKWLPSIVEALRTLCNLALSPNDKLLESKILELDEYESSDEVRKPKTYRSSATNSSSYHNTVRHTQHTQLSHRVILLVRSTRFSARPLPKSQSRTVNAS